MITTIKEFVLENNIVMPGLRLPSEDTNKLFYDDITVKDIDFKVSGDNGHNMIYLDTYINGKLEKGIILDIQLIDEILHQPHIKITNSLQGQGLSYKIYKRFVELYGNLYSASGRRMSGRIYKTLDKFSTDKDVLYFNTNGDVLVVNKLAENKDEVIELYKSIKH